MRVRAPPAPKHAASGTPTSPNPTQPIPVKPDTNAAKRRVLVRVGGRPDMTAVFRCYQILRGCLCPLAGVSGQPPQREFPPLRQTSGGVHLSPRFGFRFAVL